MTKKLKILAAVIIVGFLVVVAGLAATAAAGRPAGGVSFPSGGIERAVVAAEDQNLSATAVAPTDVYGTDYQAAVPVCPRATPDSVQEMLGLPVAPEGLPDTVDQDTNYLLLVRADGSSVADEISRDTVDMCAGPQLPPFNSGALVPLVKNEQGTWMMVG